LLNSALAIIRDEHRSLAAVVQGFHYLIQGMRESHTKPDFKLLRAMICYFEEFPEKLHHPKEDAYLFASLRRRTKEADRVIAELEQQHIRATRDVRDLALALGRYEAGKRGGLARFAVAAEKFSEQTLAHMALEESTVIPLAMQYLTPEDWVEIGVAFGKNGDPRFEADADQEYRDLFSRIVNLTPQGTLRTSRSLGGQAGRRRLD
jgi:hemerythrin-like domain-containing protein